MGGFLALEAILDVPGVAERLAGLVLVATLRRGHPRRGAAEPGRGTDPAHPPAAPPRGATPPLGRCSPRRSSARNPPPRCCRPSWTWSWAATTHPCCHCSTRSPPTTCSPDCRRIDVPTVVICGLADRTTPPRDSRRMAAAIPGARSVWVDGAGHMLPWEAPTPSATPSPWPGNHGVRIPVTDPRRRAVPCPEAGPWAT